jgi:hypothetical protein
MITFNYSPVKPEDTDAAFVETGAPVEAIVGVRNNLSDQAITRAENLAGEDTQARYKVVRVSIIPTTSVWRSASNCHAPATALYRCCSADRSGATSTIPTMKEAQSCATAA